MRRNQDPELDALFAKAKEQGATAPGGLMSDGEIASLIRSSSERSVMAETADVDATAPLKSTPAAWREAMLRALGLGAQEQTPLFAGTTSLSTVMSITGTAMGLGLAGIVAYNALLSAGLTQHSNAVIPPTAAMTSSEVSNPLNQNSASKTTPALPAEQVVEALASTAPSLTSERPVAMLTPLTPKTAATPLRATDPAPIVPPSKATLVKATPVKVTPSAGHDSLFSTPVPLEGVRLVQLKPEDLRRFGIEQDGKGELSYLSGSDGDVFRLTLLPVSGVKMFMHFKELDKNTPLPKAQPTLITDAVGRKRIFYFRDDSTSPGYHRNSQVSIINPGDIHVGDGNTDVSLHSQGNGQRVARVNVFGTQQSNSGEKQPQVVIEQGQVHAKTLTPESSAKLQGNGNHGNVFVRKEVRVHHSGNSNADSVMNGFSFKIDDSSSVPGKKFKMKSSIVINGDSLGELEDLKGLDIDALVKKAMENVDVDELVNKAMKSVDVQMLVNESMSHVNMDSIMQVAKDAVKDIKLPDMSKIGEMVDQARQRAEDRFSKINTLIPVFIEAPGSEVNKGFIFWYEPTTAFVEMLPQDEQIAVEAELEQRAKPRPGDSAIDVNTTTSSVKSFTTIGQATSGAIVKATVFPNPSNALTTLHATFSEARNVTVSVHDLLGREVRTAVANHHAEAGEMDMQIDVSGLQDGIYLLMMTTDKGEKSIQRLVVER